MVKPRRRWVYVGVGAVVAAVIGGWLVWPSEQEPAPRERRYGSFTACLLTDNRGPTGQPATSVWAGLQNASVVDLVKVQYLAVTGPQTAANAAAYFNSFGLQKCALIVAVGDAAVGALKDGRSRFPGIVYVAVGRGGPIEGVTVLDDSDGKALQERIKGIVHNAARASG